MQYLNGQRVRRVTGGVAGTVRTTTYDNADALIAIDWEDGTFSRERKAAIKPTFGLATEALAAEMREKCDMANVACAAHRGAAEMREYVIGYCDFVTDALGAGGVQERAMAAYLASVEWDRLAAHFREG